MGAAGQPAQHVFGPHDRKRKALERAVEGCGDHEPAGPDHIGATAHEQAHVGDVLDHFHGQHHIKTFAGAGESLGGCDPVVDRKAATLRVQLRSLDVVRRRIGPHHPGAEPRQRLAQNAAAAADIENADAIEARRMAGVATELPAHRIPDIGEPDWIELMQHRHLSARVPPFPGEPGKAVDLGGIDCGVGNSVWIYRLGGHVNDFASSVILDDGAELRHCAVIVMYTRHFAATLPLLLGGEDGRGPAMALAEKFEFHNGSIGHEVRRHLSGRYRADPQRGATCQA